MMKKERVVVAMSGGVDSSVAAALLKKQGYEVIGITMCFNLPDADTKKPNCCGLKGIDDARRVASKLDIKHYVLNMQEILNERVIKNFCQEYASGRTPNPCVRCNQFIKFGVLLKKAISLGAQYLATGHYARINKVQSTEYRVQSYLLQKARDLKKDQSYFLYRLKQEQLKHILFPLGNYTKIQVRSLAGKFGLHIADKTGSQEICFLAGRNYRDFLKDHDMTIKPGLIVDKEGNILGRHKGIAFYTIGQREGLGIAKGYPLYVTKIEPIANRIFLGKKEDALKSKFLVKETYFIPKRRKKKVALKVKIRYNHKEMPADVLFENKKIKVCFKKPQFAVTPGQSAVFYDKDVVVGGGVIERVLD